MLDKIDLIAYDAIKNMSIGDREVVSGKRRIHLQSLFEANVMRWIRNRYGLWDANPLTAKWRDNPDTRVMIDGVDHSYYHPDAVSARIFKFMQKHLSFYTGRAVELRMNKMVGTAGARRYSNHPMVIVKRTKAGKIEVAHAKYTKCRTSVQEAEIVFV